MYDVVKLPEFNEWLDGIKDKVTRVRLNKRLDKAARGLLGEVKPCRESVWEMKEDFGKGWRMYYIKRDNTLVVMLGGGEKSTQDADIDQAIKLSKTLED